MFTASTSAVSGDLAAWGSHVVIVVGNGMVIVGLSNEVQVRSIHGFAAAHIM